MSEITAEDVTIKDLFMQAEIDEAQYDPSLAAMYCQYILDGLTLIKAAEGCVQSLADEKGQEYLIDSPDPDEAREQRELLKKDGHNFYRRMCRWRVKFDKFDKMVKKAVQERAYAQMEEIIDIANDATDDAVMGAQGPMINGKAIRRAELMINTRKFVMSKVLPQVFGDKSQMEITGKDGKDLIPTTFNIGLLPAGTFLPPSEQPQESAEDASEGA